MPHVKHWNKKKLKKKFNQSQKKLARQIERVNTEKEEKEKHEGLLNLANAKILRIHDYFDSNPNLFWPGEPFDPFDPNDPNTPADPDDPNRPIGRDCIDFEDLVKFKEYPHSSGIASKFVSEGVQFEIVAESDSGVKLPTDPLTQGKIRVEPSPGGGVRNGPFDFGQSLMINNVLLKLDVTKLSEWKNGAHSACFKYCSRGGYCYLRINNRSWDFGTAVEAFAGTNSNELFSYDGLTIGGVDIRVTKHLYSTGGDHFGMVFLRKNSDSIKSIEIGGQEFWTDYWCIPCDEYPNDKDYTLT